MMRKCLVVLALVLFFPLSLVQAQQANAVPDKYIIQFKKGIGESEKKETRESIRQHLKAQIRQEINTEIQNHLSKINAEIITIHAATLEQLKNLNATFPSIQSIEPDYIAQKMMITNDPDLSKQWGLFTIKAAGIDVTSAWDSILGKPETLVAVLDTGINTAHPDLAGVVTLSRDFAGTASGPTDKDGHGTHVAGTIAALGNNAIGGAGVAYGVKILNGKVLDDTGSGSYSGIASGIIWAADNGAKVINLSLGAYQNSTTLNNAIDYAIGKGAVVVAAAGNESTSSILYPAGYSPVVSVTSTDQNDVKPSWANYGMWIDVAAPGVSIYSTVLNSGYAYYSGSSMSTSITSGVAALIWSKGLCTIPVCVTDKLFSTADAITGTGDKFKYGRINALKAVSNEPSTPPSATPTAGEATPTLVPTVTSGPTVTPTPTSGPTPIPSSKTISVDSITMTYTKSLFWYNLTTKVHVIDDQNKNAGSAKVNLTISSPTGVQYVRSATTNSSGEASITLNYLFAKGIYKTAVNSVTKNTYTYSPNKTEQSINVQ